MSNTNYHDSSQLATRKVINWQYGIRLRLDVAAWTTYAMTEPRLNEWAQ